MDHIDLEGALEQFDATDANIRRLESIWAELGTLVPDGIAFISGSPEDRRYRELSWAFDEIARALPAIEGFRITAQPLDLDAIAQARFDAAELGGIEVHVRLAEDMQRPGHEIDRYRAMFDRTRRRLVRTHISRVSAVVTGLLASLTKRIPSNTDAIVDEEWTQLVASFTEIERLVGGMVPRDKEWVDLRRHLRFSQGQDLHGIATRDWPSVKIDLEKHLYTELEPLPVRVSDLAALVAAAPSGRVTVQLPWDRLPPEGFERLVFNLISDATGYENPQWLTNTTAPDRGRDLSVERVRGDPLAGTIRERVIIQARHRRATAVSVADLATLTAQMTLWEPPPLDVLVVASSGRFSTDAVAWSEQHNQAGSRPRIEMWPDSHLELLLASRPHLVAASGLRD